MIEKPFKRGAVVSTAALLTLGLVAGGSLPAFATGDLPGGESDTPGNSVVANTATAQQQDEISSDPAAANAAAAGAA